MGRNTYCMHSLWSYHKCERTSTNPDNFLSLSMTKKHKNFQKNDLSMLTRRYIYVLLMLGILMVGSRWILHQSISGQEVDARQINVAGRQRKLSQSIAKEILAIQTADTASERQKYLLLLEQSLAQWKQAHEGLQFGDAELGVYGNNSDTIKSLFNEIDPFFLDMVAVSNSLIETLTNNSSSFEQQTILADIHAEKILLLEAQYLNVMEQIVKRYEIEAEQKITRLKNLENTILMVLLGVLVIQGLIIFRPTFKQIERVVSQLSNAQKDLVAALEEASVANEAKSIFLANVSHELRTPLNGLMGITQMMEETAVSSQEKQNIHIIKQCSERLLSLVDNILAVYRIETNQNVTKPELTNFTSLIDEVVAYFSPVAKEKGVGFIFQSTTSIPKSFFTDKKKVRQILFNLIGNSFKFTSKGNVTVSLCAKEGSNQLCTLQFRIADTGVGISQVEAKKLFKNFAQLDDSISRKHEGLGLGLGVSKHMAEYLGGELWIEQSDKPGAIVCFTIQVQLPPQSEQQFVEDIFLETDSRLARRVDLSSDELRAQHHSKQPNLERDGISVLLVEDNKINQRVEGQLLKRLGYQFRVARNGVEALAAMCEEPANIILMDIHMPEMDGLEATKRILSKYIGDKRPYIIAVTANAVPGDRRRFLAAGMNDYVSKPVRLPLLKEALDRGVAHIQQVAEQGVEETKKAL